MQQGQHFDVLQQLNKIASEHGGMANLSQIIKAAETNSTYTFDPAVRSVFTPENLDYEIKMTVPMDTPMRNRLPRKPGLGMATAWERLISKLHSRSGGAAGNGTNTSIAFADATAPNETSQQYTVESAPYKLLGRKIEVGGLAIAASNNRPGVAGNMFTDRRRTKMIEVMIGEEELIIGGDKTANALEFDGFGAQITTYSGVRSLLSVSGVNDDIATVFKEGGRPTALLVNSRQTTSLGNQLQGTGAIQRIVVDNQGNAIGGLRLAKIMNQLDGSLIDMITSRYVANQGFLLTEKANTGEVYIEMEDLIPMSQVDVPSAVFSTVSFVLEASVLKVMAEPYQYKYTGQALF